MEARTIYLDNNATTPLHPEVRKELIEALENFGNPSSLHQYGRMSRVKVEKARESVARFIGAGAEEIIFVGSGSEASNSVVSTLTCQPLCMSEFGVKGKEMAIITTLAEHPATIEAVKCLQGDFKS